MTQLFLEKAQRTNITVSFNVSFYTELYSLYFFEETNTWKVFSFEKYHYDSQRNGKIKTKTQKTQNMFLDSAVSYGEHQHVFVYRRLSILNVVQKLSKYSI